MNFTLQQLNIFRMLCDTKSVTKTSEKLHLTQPAISIQLKNLQSQFDQPIFETIGKKIHITPFGVMLNNKIESIIKELEVIPRFYVVSKTAKGQRMTGRDFGIFLAWGQQKPDHRNDADDGKEDQPCINYPSPDATFLAKLCLTSS